MRVLARVDALSGFVRHDQKPGFEICGFPPNAAHRVRMRRPFDDFFIEIVDVDCWLTARYPPKGVQRYLSKFRASTILGIERKPNSPIALLFAPFEKVHRALLHRHRCCVARRAGRNFAFKKLDFSNEIWVSRQKPFDLANGMENRGVVTITEAPADVRK